MSTAWVECWKCDDCGFRWIKGEIYPERCASSKCRKRSFNNTGSGEESQTQQTAAVGVRLPEPSDNRQRSALASPTKPDMQSLREICTGKVADVGVLERMEHLPTTTVSAEIPICGKRWWEDVTQYECLMDKGHRDQKHGLRGMVQRLED